MALKKSANKKPAASGKRGPKAKQVEEEKPEMEVEGSEDESEEQNDAEDASDSEVEAAQDSGAEENDDEEDDDDDDDDAEDDEVEPGEISKEKVAADSDNEDDSDEEPVEEPITKKSKITNDPPKKAGIPKVAVGRIPRDTPKEQIVFLTNLPIDYKHNDLVALLTKFGPVAVINRIKTQTGGNTVQIAFESADGAEAAVTAKEKALTINGHVVTIRRPLERQELNERTIVVGLIGPNCTKEQVLSHFSECGKVDKINFSNNRDLPTAFLRFENVESVESALKLHGSELNSRFITVRKESYKSLAIKSPGCTLTISNTGNYESYKSDSIEKIFKKHGEIVDVDLVCTRTILGFVTFKAPEQAEKAFKQVNGKTVNDLEVKLERYHFSSSARSVLVTNLAPGVDEEALTTTFTDCGEIENIKMLGNKAIIKFTTDNGFCQSFMLNERIIQGQPIFLEPNSILKHKILKKKSAGKQFGGFNKHGNNKQNNNYNNNKKPFNKRKFQDNGSSPEFAKKSKFT